MSLFLTLTENFVLKQVDILHKNSAILVSCYHICNFPGSSWRISHWQGVCV